MCTSLFSNCKSRGFLQNSCSMERSSNLLSYTFFVHDVYRVSKRKRYAKLSRLYHGQTTRATEAEGYAPDYYLGSAIAQFSLLILPFALPVWFVRKWTKKWNANIDKQNIPTTDD